MRVLGLQVLVLICGYLYAADVGAKHAMEAAHVIKDLGELDEAIELYELARDAFASAG